MGGIAIVGAATAGYLIAHLRKGVIFTDTGLLVMASILGAGFVGFLDDWIKVTNARNLGLNKRTKSLGLLAVALAFSIAMVSWTGIHTTLSFTRFDHPGWELHSVGWILWAVFIIEATSNGVNLADGLDGLAAGSAILAFTAFTIFGFGAFRHPAIYQVPHALDLAVIAACMGGACAGFLWWNAAPAQIFMGDTGSLAIGTGLAALGLGLNTQLLLPIVCALYVGETLSVILQAISYRRFGRRIFRLSPIHHHFEFVGWPETTILIRFWIFAGIATAVGVGLYYADFLHAAGIH
jgi:phospho-N-acetylmuramoyl-pentapeptide-transferase